jgi:hypothetical protein
MRIGCCDLVGVDSKNLRPLYFHLFCLCFLLSKTPKFGTRLK